VTKKQLSDIGNLLAAKVALAYESRLARLTFPRVMCDGTMIMTLVGHTDGRGVMRRCQPWYW
jgi:hypothetical protein